MDKYKYCPRCGEYKPVAAFQKNASRSDGLQGWCRECQSLAGKKRKPECKPQHTHKQAMTGEQFLAFLDENRWLRDHIKIQAARKTRDRELRKDLEQECWIRLSFCPCNIDVIAIKRVVSRALSQAYMKEYRRKHYDLSYIETMSKDEYAMWLSGCYMP